MKTNVLIVVPTVLLVGLLGCSKQKIVETKDISKNVGDYYAANLEFFTFATLEDLPDDLTWGDGSEQSEMGSPMAKKGGTYYSSIADFPRTLRLVGPDAAGGFRGFILDDNAVLLTKRHRDTLEHVPGIAREWAIGKDGATVFYRIDPEARYSDGIPIRADDFLFLFYFMRSPHIKGPWYNDYFTKKFKNITKYDDLTLSITYSEAKPDIIYLTSLRPVPRHFYDEFGEDFLERYNYRFEPTTGPYEILPENMKKGRSVTLTKVKDWWLKDRKHYRYRYNPDKIRLQVIREPSKAFEVFRKGETDDHGLGLPEYWYKQLPDDAPEVQAGYIEKITFYNEIPGPDWALRLNCSKPLLDNQDIRIGLNYACNWDLVIENVFYGDFQRMNTSADGFGKLTHPTLKARPFDPKKAEEHFAKAGFTKRGPDGILVNDAGQRLSFTITTGYKTFEEVLTVLKQEAKKAGVELNLEIMEYTASWKKAKEKKHEINFGALNRSVELYPRFWEMFHSYHAYDENGKIRANTNNDTQTALPELDPVIDTYRFSDDLDEMTRLSHDISEKLHDHAAYIPGWRKPWIRMGKWRWLKFPEYFEHRTSRNFYESQVFWIDDDIKRETLEAKKSGATFGPVIRTYDQHKLDS